MASEVVRVSIGRFDAEIAQTVEEQLVAGMNRIMPELRKLPGLVSYSAGVDKKNNALSNVSVWQSLAQAEQMATFQPMLDLAKEFVALGVRFERPILNFETVWSIGGDR